MGKKNGLKTIVIFMLTWAIPFLPAISLGQSDAPAQGEALLTMGSAAIPHDNLALAKKRAIGEALSKGVEGYVLRQLSNRDLIHNFERITRDLIPAAKEAIENFNILAEQSSDGTYTVLVKFKMNEGLIKDRLRGVEQVIPSRIQRAAVSALVQFQGNKDTFIARVMNHPELPFPLRLDQEKDGHIVLNLE